MTSPASLRAAEAIVAHLEARRIHEVNPPLYIGITAAIIEREAVAPLMDALGKLLAATDPKRITIYDCRREAWEAARKALADAQQEAKP